MTMGAGQNDLYRQAADDFGPALARLASCYEKDADKRRDLAQDIHLALWRSFAGFDGRCSLRTWTYRVAHNAAASYVIRERRAHAGVFVGLEEIENRPTAESPPSDRGESLERLLALIHQLQPLDRQVILSFLEGLDAAEIAEITGLSPGNVATKVHRIKTILSRRFQEGIHHAR